MEIGDLHPIDIAIIKCLSMDLYATANQVSKAINIHPQTATKYMNKLEKYKIVLWRKRGNRIYWKLNERKKITWKMKN